MSKLSAPLRALTENGIEWTWSSTQTKAFEDVKKAIAEAATLKFFNPRQETVVQCDASSQGLGAVIMQNGQPVAFASRALSSAEVNYCQIEKELLAVVFALTVLINTCMVDTFLWSPTTSPCKYWSRSH